MQSARLRNHHMLLRDEAYDSYPIIPDRWRDTCLCLLHPHEAVPQVHVHTNLHAHPDDYNPLLTSPAQLRHQQMTYRPSNTTDFAVFSSSRCPTQLLADSPSFPRVMFYRPTASHRHAVL